VFIRTKDPYDYAGLPDAMYDDLDFPILYQFDDSDEDHLEGINARRNLVGFGQLQQQNGLESNHLFRKKWLVYGEYAGGFANFNRKDEIDHEDDEVDEEIKRQKSAGKFDTNRGDGWGHIGKGSSAQSDKGSEILNSLVAWPGLVYEKQARDRFSPQNLDRLSC